MERSDPVSTLKGIGEQREKRLHRLNIFTVEQLLTHYPRDYKDRSQIMKINELIPNETATFLGQVRGEGQNGGRGRMVFTPYMKSSLEIGERYLFTGKVQQKGRQLEVVSPECERIGENFAGGRIIPVYPSVEGLSQKTLRGLVEQALRETADTLPEELPLWLKGYRIAERNFAIENIHFPKTEQGFYDARRRLVFEELFLLQAALFRLKQTLVTFAALFCVVVFVADASGAGVLDRLIEWGSETFSLRPASGVMELEVAEENGFKSLAEALEYYEVENPAIPTWIPNRYSIDRVAAMEAENTTTISGRYTTDSGTLFIRVAIGFGEDFTFEENQTAEHNMYQAKEIEFVLSTNMDTERATWDINGVTYSAGGNISLDELKEMLDSIQP